MPHCPLISLHAGKYCMFYVVLTFSKQKYSYTIRLSGLIRVEILSVDNTSRDTASMQCRVTISPPGKHHSNGVSLASRRWSAYRCLLGEELMTIVLPRSNDHVYICFFVNIEIQTLDWHYQQSAVVLKTI